MVSAFLPLVHQSVIWPCWFNGYALEFIVQYFQWWRGLIIAVLYRFLLYYTSRDTVDVLAQGTKGLADMRDVAENYYNGTRTPEGQTGPLYGMIDFRRRKILVKLVLEGTSRLVKGCLIFFYLKKTLLLTC
jgi:hypothetical protein